LASRDGAGALVQLQKEGATTQGHSIPNLPWQRQLGWSIYFSQFVLLCAFDKLSGLAPPRTIFPQKTLSASPTYGTVS